MPVDQKLLAGPLQLHFDRGDLGGPRESAAEREGRLHTVIPGKSIPTRGEESVELPARLIAKVVDDLSFCFEPKVIIVVPPVEAGERARGSQDTRWLIRAYRGA